MTSGSTYDLQLSTSTRWVVARSLLTPDLPVELPQDLDSIPTEATRLRVAPRIYVRCGRGQLARELGEPLAGFFLSSSRHAALQALKIEAQVHHVAEVARRHGLQFALLKGAALHLLRYAGVGARPLVDLDLLAPKDDAHRLQRALLSEGWERTTAWRSDYHLPPLHRAGSLPVEIHDHVPLITVNGTTWATWNDLQVCGLLVPLTALAPGVTALAPQALMGHALAHAVVQPRSMMERTAVGLCSDLLDIGAGNGGLGDATRRLVGPYLPSSIVDETASLVSRLAIDQDGSLEKFEAVLATLKAAQVVTCGSRKGRIIDAVHRLPGCPNPAATTVRRVLELAFACKVSLDRVYGRKTGESYARLLARRYWCLASRGILGALLRRNRPTGSSVE